MMIENNKKEKKEKFNSGTAAKRKCYCLQPQMLLSFRANATIILLPAISTKQAASEVKMSPPHRNFS
ncbi:hypothetical protein D0T60_02505 [Bacteroides sp. 224]|nr:hypothetical protein [Bacteroides sp. 224]